MKKIITILFAAFFLLNIAKAQNVGDLAPDFTLKDLNNVDYKLSANRGKVILVFLIGYNCTTCIASSPTVKSTIVQTFQNNSNFQTVVVDVWNGNYAGVNAFKSSTGLNARYLQKGSTVASSWKSTKDRLFVIDSKGKFAFTGTKVAGSDAGAAKTAVQNALNNITTTSAGELEEVKGFRLGQNYPNPVQNETTIEFSLGETSQVNISFYDVSGKNVYEAVNSLYPAGSYEFTVQKNRFQKGIYYYRIKTESFTSAKKMIIP